MNHLSDFYRQWVDSRPVEPIVLEEPVPVEDLQTPALVIDLEVFEANLDRMQSYLDRAGILLRPHTKMHKCPIIARQQIEKGARGVCAAKLGEAEVLCGAGIEDVLITSPLAGADKLERFMTLRTEHVGVKLVVDNEQVVSRLASMA
ncbi:MAG: alanine racemase, partial [Pseudomonadales bacterium]|nr:alanine racemase [Pseudomonadales bacterium]